MIDAPAFLQLLRAAGLTVRSEGDRLFVQPRESLTEADVASVKACKPHLMNLLALERMTECRKCGSAIDPESRADVGAACGNQPCPNRVRGR
jgi:hypothetical protein